jgi:hypothetical protein
MTVVESERGWGSGPCEIEPIGFPRSVSQR